jgi:hypothetical protein
METIEDTLKRRLKGAGIAKWESIADAVNAKLEKEDRVTFNSLRKIAYGERPNLGLKVAQALLDFFAEQDRREQAKA